VDKPKRSYYLPAKLVNAFDKDVEKSGYVREKVVAAALLAFLDSDASTRARMLDRLDSFINSKKS
jgi:hypothetical protein